MYTNATDVKLDAGFDQNSNISSTLVNKYITQADAEIDSALAKNYVLPLSETPSLIEAISMQLASGLLLLKEYGYDEGLRDIGKVKVANARDLIKKIADKTLTVLNSAKAIMATVATDTIRFNPSNSSTSERKFTMDKEF